MVIFTNDIAESCEQNNGNDTEDLVESSCIKVLVGKVN
jgi:hypothetical protein